VAVKRQSVSDVPLGVLLSGGVDSAAVTALLSRHLNGPLQTFTVGFPDYQGIDELEAANETARLFNTQHHAIKIGYIDFQSHLMKTIWRLDEPIATTSTFALDAVCSTAKEYVKVVLTGQGADEPFGGYQRYLAARYGRVINKWFSPLWLWGRSITRRMFPRWEAWQRAWHSVGVKDQTQWFIAMIEVFSPAMKEKIYQDRKDDKESFSRAVIDYWRKDIDHLEPLSQMSYVDMRLSLADDLLMYGDKISMAHSLEMRVPLLDIELIKAVETMPDRMRINGFKRKYIYKKALKEWLPKENLNRPKKGFLTPVEFLLEQDLGNYATQLFFDRKSALSQYFSIGYIKELP
jgi:asparagine synthase (glutamine-hydrolysing)